MMNRRTLIGAAAAAAAFPALDRVANAQTAPKTKNVVFVHGLFADGSCWSNVIARLQQKGINCTSAQNPLTSLSEASEAARRVIAAQPGPTVLVGHSFSGMIVSEVGVDPKVTALVYVAARAPDAGEDYTALAKNYPTPRPPPALSSTTIGADCRRRLSCATSLAICRRYGRAFSTRFNSHSRGR
jgi:pimeloyl-ACP methyl ester carboxylesterase